MKKTGAIFLTSWLFLYGGLLTYRFRNLSFPFLSLRDIGFYSFLFVLPIVFFLFGFAVHKRQGSIKRGLKIFLAFLLIAACAFSLGVSTLRTAVSWTDDCTSYLMPDKDVNFDQLIKNTFPERLPDSQVVRYFYVRGANPLIWNRNGWRMGLLVQYTRADFEKEVSRLYKSERFIQKESFLPGYDNYYVGETTQEGLSVYVMFSPTDSKMIYYAAYLDFANVNTHDFLLLLTKNT